MSTQKVWAFPTFFVDPSNSSGLANDLNGGLTSTTPILTTAELNKRMAGRAVTVDSIVTYMSDDNSTTQLDFSTMTITRTGSLTFQGTPQILHTGGTFNVGTNTINPATQQRQTVHTTDLATFNPFVFTGLGGASADPCLIVDKTNPNLNNSAWIVSGTSTANCSRPVSSALTSGGFTVGDSYVIQRGSRLFPAPAPPNLPVGIGDFGGVPSNSTLQFIDFNFNANFLGGYGASYIRCAFLNTLVIAQCSLVHCFITTDIESLGFLFMTAGVYVTTGQSVMSGQLTMNGDVYVTGFQLIISSFMLSNVLINDQGSVGGSGIQVQDMTASTAAVLIDMSANLGAGLVSNPVQDPAPVLIWGNGNAGVGIQINPGATLTIAAGSGVRPTVTGAGGDFGFTAQNGGALIQVARAWNDATGAYTEAGGAATRATTWANFATAIGGGGLAFQAHNPATGASVVGV